MPRKKSCAIGLLSLFLLFSSLPFVGVLEGNSAAGDGVKSEALTEENLSADVTEKNVQAASSAKKDANGAVTSVVVQSENALLGWIRQGGTSMYLIILCSMLGTYFIVERLITLRQKNIIPPEFVNAILKNLSDARGSSSGPEIYDELMLLCEKSNTPISRTLRAGLLVVDEGPVGIKSIIDGAAVLEGAIMEKNLNLLALTANLAPLLGFLGTVTGMIGAFQAIVHAKNIGAAVVAAGISQALITTAAGLFVGIPLLAMYYFIQGKVETFMIEMSNIANEASESFAHLGGTQG